MPLLKSIADKLDEMSESLRQQLAASMGAVATGPQTTPLRAPDPGLLAQFDTWMNDAVQELSASAQASHLAMHVAAAGTFGLLSMVGISLLLGSMGGVAE